jgi:hypothetical protein
MRRGHGAATLDPPQMIGALVIAGSGRAGRLAQARDERGAGGIYRAGVMISRREERLGRRALRLQYLRRLESRPCVIAHPYRADQAAVRWGTGAARASRMAASAVRRHPTAQASFKNALNCGAKIVSP